jgi:hypothetical protein
MARKRIASYYRRGYMMSRRARTAVQKNEHPVTIWKERLVMDEEQIAQLLIYMGNHHVGPECILIPFYRLPDVDDQEELMSIYGAFHKVPANKLNFIRIMSMHLQKEIEERGVVLPRSERPRKKKKRRSSRRRKSGRKRNAILNRTTW